MTKSLRSLIIITGIVFNGVSYDVNAQKVIEITVLDVDSMKFNKNGYLDFHIKTKNGVEHILIDLYSEQIQANFLHQNIGEKIKVKLGKLMEFRNSDGITFRHNRFFISEIHEDENLIIDLSETAKERYYSIYKK